MLSEQNLHNQQEQEKQEERQNPANKSIWSTYYFRNAESYHIIIIVVVISPRKSSFLKNFDELLQPWRPLSTTQEAYRWLVLKTLGFLSYFFS